MKIKLYFIISCSLFFNLLFCSCNKNQSLLKRDANITEPVTHYNAESCAVESCTFCKIVSGALPSEKVYEDENMLIFQNAPKKRFPIHLLAIPKKHISSLGDVCAQDKEILGHILVKIAEIVKTKFSTELKNGFRVHTNSGKDAHQSIKHIHFHITGGEKLPFL